MKKFLSLALVLVMVISMAIPAFAATEDEVAPCAAYCNSHTVNNPIYYKYDYATLGAGPGKNCRRTTTTYYECGNCHEIFSQKTATDDISHVASAITSSCNGTYQTIRYNCKNCGGYYYTDDDVPCPGAVHTGNCRWLPV